MFRFIFTTSLLTIFSITSFAKEELPVESEVISLIGKNGFEIKNKESTFSFKPYILLQTSAQANYVDDEGLGLADYDNFTNTGFGVSNAIIGFAGKSFENIHFNLALNAAGVLLSQAWLELYFDPAFRFKMGKFKTPMFKTFNNRLGEKLFPSTALSLVTPMNLPYNLNATNPIFATGFDVGIEAHGRIADLFSYQLGIFNGEGSLFNSPKSSLSDDNGIPSWLYSARLAIAPLGALPPSAGGPNDKEETKFEFALSSSYNIEANWESTNDFRYAGEFTLLMQGLYLSLEGYALNMDFTERQRTEPDFNFYGALAQAGYLFSSNTQPVLRFEFFDRNSSDVDGYLLIPAVGLNQYFKGQNLKLQLMYQTLIKMNHSTLYDENDDDNGMPEHHYKAQIQFAF